MPDRGELIFPSERIHTLTEHGEAVFFTNEKVRIKVNQLADLGIVFKSEIIIETINKFLKGNVMHAYGAPQYFAYIIDKHLHNSLLIL